MKVKFYKGPYHNKTREVQDQQYELLIAQPYSSMRDILLEDNDRTTATLNVKYHVYSRTNHTHPDGSVFFVYKGKQ